MLAPMSFDSSPLGGHSASPVELQERLAAQRAGLPFLLLRDSEGAQRLLPLAADRLSVGRGDANDLPLSWDAEVSRLHAELERIGGQWTVCDDGLSRNGTFVAGARISGRTRLRDGDILRIGQTSIAFCDPRAGETAEQTKIGDSAAAVMDLSATQRQVLIALARPFKHGGYATPATNQQIADELHLSVDAIKAQLRGLYARVGIEDLPQQQKRQRLVAAALERGLISSKEL
jgi:pSer/pThr/pTyr-binding forkhead associated (FHA) protein